MLGEFRQNDRILVVNQSGKLKTIIPELTTHFDDDIVVLEKWYTIKPISAIYYDGEKDRYFVKRFLIENVNKEETFITENEKSQLEIVSTYWCPVAEVIFAKVKGVHKENQTDDCLKYFIFSLVYNSSVRFIYKIVIFQL